MLIILGGWGGWVGKDREGWVLGGGEGVSFSRWGGGGATVS